MQVSKINLKQIVTVDMKLINFIKVGAAGLDG